MNNKMRLLALSAAVAASMIPYDVVQMGMRGMPRQKSRGSRGPVGAPGKAGDKIARKFANKTATKKHI